MAFTYLILNFVFISLCVTVLWGVLRKPNKTWWITLIVLLLLTLVFDNIMLWACLFEYNTDKLTNLYIGLAPIEDFFYAILAAILIPALWQIFSTKKDTNV